MPRAACYNGRGLRFVRGGRQGWPSRAVRWRASGGTAVRLERVSALIGHRHAVMRADEAVKAGYDVSTNANLLMPSGFVKLEHDAGGIGAARSAVA